METHAQNNAPVPCPTERNGQFTLIHLVNVLIHTGSIAGWAVAVWCFGRALAEFWGAAPAEARVTGALLVAVSIPVGWVIHQVLLLVSWHLFVIVVACAIPYVEQRSKRGRMKVWHRWRWSLWNPVRAEPNGAPIRSPDLVDFAGQRLDGGAELWIVVRGPLDDSAAVLDSIREKVATYLAVIDLDEFQAEMGHPPRDRTRIVIWCDHPIHPNARAVIDECRAVAAERGVRLEVPGPAAQPQNDGPSTGHNGAYTPFDFVRLLVRDGLIAGCTVAAWCLGGALAAFQGAAPIEAFKDRASLVVLSLPVGWIVAAAFGCASYPGRRFLLIEYLERRNSE